MASLCGFDDTYSNEGMRKLNLLEAPLGGGGVQVGGGQQSDSVCVFLSLCVCVGKCLCLCALLSARCESLCSAGAISQRGDVTR